MYKNYRDNLRTALVLRKQPGLPDILRYRMVLELFVVAFVFYVLHTVIDSTQEPYTTTSVILEESAKLFCGTFLALGAFIGFLGVLCKSTMKNGALEN